MAKLVIFNILTGNFTDGFPLLLQIANEGEKIFHSLEEKLPPSPTLQQSLKKWQDYYSQYTKFPSEVNKNEVQSAKQELEKELETWFQSLEILKIINSLFDNLTDKNEPIRIIIKTDNHDLQNLPWHLWRSFFVKYPKAEFSIGLPLGRNAKIQYRDKVKILAVFGDNTNINTNRDRKLLISYLTAKRVHILQKPALKKLSEELLKYQPHVLFYAGHSEIKDNTINLKLKKSELITINSLEPYLRNAVENGLQLAIFNSCHSGDIAREIARLDIHIPAIIGMREKIPDIVAQEFLESFLQEFTPDKSVCLAVRKAREKIYYLESQYPGVTFLPVVFQNPGELPLTGAIFREQNSIDNTVFQQEQNTAIINTHKTQLEVTEIYITCSQKHQNISTNNFCTDCGEKLLKPSNLFTLNYSDKILTEGDVLKEQYKIIKKIGLGGFGNTYLAEDLHLPSGRKCVVKELKYQDRNIIRLFEREAKILEYLGEKTKQIPKLYAYFQQYNSFYLVQDYINGISLDQEICTGNQMSELEVKQFLYEMLKILNLVHENYIVHRDIKPGNIMRKVEGDLVLIDFGIAKQISNINNQPGNLTKVFTPGYAPPEQMIGHVYFNSDIYALGMVCIQALTGLSSEELLYQIYHNIQKYIKSLPISEQFRQILQKMIAYNWQERYQKASEVLLDFNQFVVGL